MSAPAQTGNGNESGLLDFTNIKKWIALQEASQRDTGRPTSLTPAQLKAIRELNQAALVAFAPVEPKPDRNWIGLLHSKWRAGSISPIPTYAPHACLY